MLAMSDQEEVCEIALPHDAWYDDESNMVSFSLDRCTFSFAPEDFFFFAKQLDDIATVLSQMVNVDNLECPTCGTHFEALQIVPLSDKDYH